MNNVDYDARYAGVVFQGTMEEAIAQAKAWIEIEDKPDPRPIPDNVIQFPVRK